VTALATEAIVLDRHGGPEVLERRELVLPELGPREVRVRVRAVSVNHLDIWVRKGGPAFKLVYPHRLGSDMAGEVEALGPGARGVAVGDRVMVHPATSCGVCAACKRGADNLCRSYHILGESTQGGYARHAHVADDMLLPLGDLDFHAAAALPLTTVTAWQMAFRKGEVALGDTVLVNAAGSGVSVMLIQLCKLAGARVIATTSSEAKVEAARELGADAVVLSSAPGWEKEVRRLSDGGVRVAFDHVGGALFEQTLTTLAWGGRVVTCGATAGFHPKLDLRTIFFKQLEVRGSTMGAKGDLAAALPLIRAGKLRQIVDRVLPLWDAARAHEALESRSVFGKVVLDVP
jgi:NADPH:quinone reductase-like Zn-dependent oxidoreductase